MTHSQNSQPSGHTPGPWKRERLCIFCPNGSLIAEVHEDYFTHTSEDEANARLIAAAPELLEALILLEREMVESGNAGSEDYGWKPAIEKTRAALSKAQGATK